VTAAENPFRLSADNAVGKSAVILSGGHVIRTPIQRVRRRGWRLGESRAFMRGWIWNLDNIALPEHTIKDIGTI
jgi:hypothetical protein